LRASPRRGDGRIVSAIGGSNGVTAALRRLSPVRAFANLSTRYPDGDAPGDDGEVVARALAGDRGAWRALYLAHKDFVYRVALRYLGDEAEARDVAQDVFVRVLASPEGYRPTASFRTWLYRVVANRCLNERARARNRHESLDAADALGAAVDAGGTPEDRLSRAQEQARVRDAIARLPDRQRLAVVLSRFEGLSYEEVAEALGATVSSVESLLFRARQSLARELAEG
jgi:RNA polymerase sigma-70 factor, ECF subfamily